MGSPVHENQSPFVFHRRRNEGSTVSSILSTLSSIVLVLQLVFNISNANNNENKKNENNQNNNNNNNVQTFDNIIVSMNENMSSETMMMMLGRQLKSGWISWKPLLAKMLRTLVALGRRRLCMEFSS